MTTGFAFGVLLALVACGEAPRAAPRAPAPGPDTSWIHRAKLDVDAQEFVLRTYDEVLAFPFRVRLVAPLDGPLRDRLRERGVVVEGEGQGEGQGEQVVVRARPADLEVLVGDERVLSAQCAAPPASTPENEEWRRKVDPDVRTVVAANSSCFMLVLLRFGGDAGDDERRQLEALGAVVRAFDARSSLAYVPIRAIPRVASLGFVASVEPPERVFEGN